MSDRVRRRAESVAADVWSDVQAPQEEIAAGIERAIRHEMNHDERIRRLRPLVAEFLRLDRARVYARRRGMEDSADSFRNKAHDVALQICAALNRHPALTASETETIGV